MQNPIHKYQIDKSILGYILFGFALLAVCIYIKDLWQGVMSLIDVLKPVIFGLAFADAE